MSVEKEKWAEAHRYGCLSASQMGCALGLRGCVSDFIHYERELKHTHLAFKGNEFTSHGIKIEPIARGVYEFYTGNEVLDGGFHVHTEHTFLGCSPDGIIINTDGSIGILEIKSPFHSLYTPGNPSNMSNGIPKAYMCQMQCQMEITNTAYCDFFVYLHDTRDRVAWRVKRSAAWWAWAKSKLILVSRAISAESVPEALRSRKFCFPAFDFDTIDAHVLIASKKHANVFGPAALCEPRGYALHVGDHCFLYEKETIVCRNVSGFAICGTSYLQARPVRIIENGSSDDPYYTVFDSEYHCIYRALGKNLFAQDSDPDSGHIVPRQSTSPPRKRLHAEKDISKTEIERIRPLLFSVRDIGEYYGSLSGDAKILIVEGVMNDGHKPAVGRLLERVISRFHACAYCTYKDLMRCMRPIEKDEEESSEPDTQADDSVAIADLKAKLVSSELDFVLIFGENESEFFNWKLLPSWSTPTLFLPAFTSLPHRQKSTLKKAPDNVIMWSDGCLRQRCRVISSYWG